MLMKSRDVITVVFFQIAEKCRWCPVSRCHSPSPNLRGDNGTEEISFYLVNKKVGVYQVNDPGYSLRYSTLSTQLWFGGKKLAPRHRLGSNGGYYPYGEERTGVVQNDDSFATY